ncbi:hypothetical protein [Methylibium sp.]|uniref:hypothetical protein n=1 Tax=Methylibium sp. TaxID=2067992 RepID=UPI003D100BE7
MAGTATATWRRFAASTLGFWFAAASVLVVPAARSEEWSLENTVQTRLESNDNYRLSATPKGRVDVLSLGSALTASRRAESSATRIDAGVTGYVVSGESGQNRVDGNLGLSQSITNLVDSYNVDLRYLRDSTFDSELTTTGVVLARGQRSSASASAGWSRALTERLRFDAQASLADVSYERQQSGGTDYRYAVLSGSLEYLVSELDRLSVRFSHSDYRAAAAGTHSEADDFLVGWSHTLSERMSASVDYGLYFNRSADRPLVCPAPSVLCEFGLVEYARATQDVVSSSRGGQYSAAWQYRSDEVTDAEVRLSLQLQPSGASVLLETQSFSATLNRRLSPTVTGKLDAVDSRSRYLGAGIASRPSYRSLGVAVSKALDLDLSVEAGWRAVRSLERLSGSSAHSNLIYASLKYDWPRFSASR